MRPETLLSGLLLLLAACVAPPPASGTLPTPAPPAAPIATAAPEMDPAYLVVTVRHAATREEIPGAWLTVDGEWRAVGARISIQPFRYATDPAGPPIEVRAGAPGFQDHHWAARINYGPGRVFVLPLLLDPIPTTD